MTTPHILVAGGGPSGLAAALAAARCGASVTLIEPHPVLGGMGTAGLVNNFCGGYHDRSRFLIGGIFGELRQRMIAAHALYETRRMEPYEPEVYHRTWSEMLAEAGVQTQLGRRLQNLTELPDSRLQVNLDNGSQLLVDGVVDATGDGLIAHMAGVKRQLGRDGDGAVMPVTMCYRFTGLDIEAAAAGWPSHVDPVNGHTRPVYTDPHSGERNFFHSGHSDFIDPLIVQERAAGRLSIPRDHVAVIQGVPGCPGDATVNFGRVFIDDPTDPEQMARAQAAGEAQVHDGIAFFRRCFPGFENIRLVTMARAMGVRQSYQIDGQYRLTAEDCLSQRQFEDVIAQCNYMIDIHEPGSDKTTCQLLPHGTHYDIPWRCLIPRQGPARLIVAGRCISADAGAMASFRVQAPAMAIGEAAGIGIALAAQRGVALADLGHEAVQERLRAVGAVLE
ncbi:MAG: FAD-dependent oxidoreductase [Planctomycetota bacterium]|nr:MAG: FAD-dependent oxidoreductase [Planctomycetota bacterium]